LEEALAPVVVGTEVVVAAAQMPLARPHLVILEAEAEMGLFLVLQD
jgi:hypothetical protein